MTRIFDFIFSLTGLILLSPLILVILIIAYFDTGSPVFRQERMGRMKRPFKILKVRSMVVDAESVPTHMVDSTKITYLGRFLRKTKLDEIIQLWNVLIGDMSLVGPRPNLFNQIELIRERDVRGVYTVKPGITGLAQIGNIDMSTPTLLAETDARMINDLNIRNYFKYIIFTVLGKGFGDRVRFENYLSKKP